MKKGIFTVLLFFLILMISPVAAKADLVYEPEEEISSIDENESENSDEDTISLPLIIGGLVLILVIVTGILIWFFFGTKPKS